MGFGNGLKHFQDVGQFTGELLGWGLPCLVGLFDELFQESGPVALLVKDAGDGPVPVCLDDLRDAATDGFVYEICMARTLPARLRSHGVNATQSVCAGCS